MANEKKKVKALRVVAKREGFRRCGRRFGAEPVEIPLSELKPAEREALTSDPQLVAVEVDIEVAPSGDEATK